MGMKRISLDGWLKKFKPVANHIHPDQGGLQIDDQSYMFETFGEELAFVQAQDPAKVWTLLDCDGKLYISEGFHYVNRMGYFVTEVPYVDGDMYSIRYD